MQTHTHMTITCCIVSNNMLCFSASRSTLNLTLWWSSMCQDQQAPPEVVQACLPLPPLPLSLQTSSHPLVVSGCLKRRPMMSSQAFSLCKWCFVLVIPVAIQMEEKVLHLIPVAVGNPSQFQACNTALIWDCEWMLIIMYFCSRCRPN